MFRKKNSYGEENGGFVSDILKVVLAVVLIAGAYAAAVKIGNDYTEREMAWQEMKLADRV